MAWLPVAGAVIVGLYWLGTVRDVAVGVRLWFALPSRTQVEGVVVQRRTDLIHRGRSRGPRWPDVFWIAIDDGSHVPRITGLRIHDHHWRTVLEGDRVRARIGRKRGWIADVTVLEPSARREELARQAQEAAESGAPQSLLGRLEAVRQRQRPDRIGPTTPDPGELVTPQDLQDVLGWVVTRTKDAETGDLPLHHCRHHTLGGGRADVTVTRVGQHEAALRAAGRRAARRKGAGPSGTPDVHEVKPGFVQALAGDFLVVIRLRRPPGGQPPADVLEDLARQAVERATKGVG